MKNIWMNSEALKKMDTNPAGNTWKTLSKDALMNVLGGTQPTDRITETCGIQTLPGDC